MDAHEHRRTAGSPPAEAGGGPFPCGLRRPIAGKVEDDGIGAARERGGERLRLWEGEEQGAERSGRHVYGEPIVNDFAGSMARLGPRSA